MYKIGLKKEASTEKFILFCMTARQEYVIKNEMEIRKLPNPKIFLSEIQIKFFRNFFFTVEFLLLNNSV